MPPFRNLRWVGLGLAILLGLAFLAIRLTRPNEPTAVQEAPQKEAQTVAELVKFVGETQRLVPGQPIERELKGGEGHAYELELKAGEYAHVVVEQKGIDVEARLIRPDGKRRVVDSPNWTQGPEVIYEIVERPGAYLLEVACPDTAAKPARYQVLLDTPRVPTLRDQRHFEAWTTFRTGEKLRRQQEYREALEGYGKALAIWQKLPDRAWEADALDRIGWMHLLLGEYREAAQHLSQALPVFRESNRRFEEGMVLYRLGEAHNQLGDWRASLAAQETALSIFRQLRAIWLEASALNGIGNASNAGGDVEKALASYRAALAVARAASLRADEGTALHGIGDILVYQGKLDRALDVLEDALRAWTAAGNPSARASTLRRIAVVDQRQGRFEKSLRRLTEALEIAQAAGDRVEQGVIWNSIGTGHLHAAEKLEGAEKRKTQEKAGEAYRQALDLFQSDGNRHGEAFALLNLGRYFYEIRDLRQSVAFHDRAAELFHVLDLRRGEASTLFGSARALRDLGDFAAAHERLTRVVDKVEFLRSGADSLDLRSSFFATRQHYYDLLIDVLMHRAEQTGSVAFVEQALDVNERRKARGLLDFLTEARADIERDADPVLVDRERDLQDKINSVELELMESQEQSSKIATLERERRDLQDEFDQVLGNLRARSPRYARMTRPEPLDVAEIRKQILGRDTTLLVYSLGEPRSFLWCIPHEGEVTTYVLPRRNLLDDMARAVHRYWSRSGRGRSGMAAKERLAARLSRALLKEVAPRLTNRRLLIVGDGALQYLPFAALPDPRSLRVDGTAGGARPIPLVESHEIVYIPSASALAVLREEIRDRAPKLRKIAVIADPVFEPDDPRILAKRTQKGRKPDIVGNQESLQRSASDLGRHRFPRLPFTSEEAAVIRQHVSKPALFEALDFDASRETVQSSELQNFRLLHFATHGILNAKHPNLSGLVLSLVDEQGQRRKGFLLAHEICNLRLPAELAVLSACETGLGMEVRGEGLVGLTRSFMYAGVPRLVVSLWKVDDRGTSELMKRFYRILLTRDIPPPQALRCAQLSMIKDPRWSDPYFWAPFVFQGEWRWRTGLLKGGIEQPGTVVGPSKLSDDDLPPPVILGGEIGCPGDIDFE